MKILGLSFGTKMGSTEILVKEALMGAEELGAEVGFTSVPGLDIRSCKGCLACTESLFRGGPGRCSIKDDLRILDEQFMECDGLILGCPVYSSAPSGLFKTVADRLGGPSHDVGFRMEARKIWEATGQKGQPPDARSFKPRVGGFISQGGSLKRHYLSLGLSLMHLMTFPLKVDIVDQMQVHSLIQFGHAVLNEAALERARTLGRRVGEALHQPVSDRRWMGDETGICPVCHSDLLRITKGNTVDCPICGISGEIKADGSTISVTFSEEEQQRSKLRIPRSREHWIEVAEDLKIAEARMRTEGPNMPAKLEKYRGYGEINPDAAN